MSSVANIAFTDGFGTFATTVTPVGLYECEVIEELGVGLRVCGIAVIEFPYRRKFSEALRKGTKLPLYIRISNRPDTDDIYEGDFLVEEMRIKKGDEHEPQYSFKIFAEPGEYSSSDGSPI